jgi:hypothetical protein
MARNAMQPPAEDENMGPRQPQRNYGAMFAGAGEPDGDEGIGIGGGAAPADRGSMF